MKRLHFPRMTLYSVQGEKTNLPEITCAYMWDTYEQAWLTSCGETHFNCNGCPEQDILYCPYCQCKIYIEDE